MTQRSKFRFLRVYSHKLNLNMTGELARLAARTLLTMVDFARCALSFEVGNGSGRNTIKGQRLDHSKITESLTTESAIFRICTIARWAELLHYLTPSVHHDYHRRSNHFQGDPLSNTDRLCLSVFSVHIGLAST